MQTLPLLIQLLQKELNENLKAKHRLQKDELDELKGPKLWKAVD